MAAWVFQSVTAKQSGTGTVNVNYPATVNAGDTLYLFCARGFGSGITYTATAFTSIIAKTSQNSSAILYRVADGTEGGTTTPVSNSGGSNCTYWMARFTGGPAAADFPAAILSTDGVGFNNTGIRWGGNLSITQDNCLVLVLATKQASLTSYNIPSPWTGEIVHSVTGDGGQSFISDYLIQTTATPVTAGTWTVTGDVSAVNQYIMVAIAPASAAIIPVVGEVQTPGNPALSSPRNPLQFQGVGRVSAPAPVIAASLTGVSYSMSVAYGPNVPPATGGFVPQPGPGISPFSNNQFTSRFGDTSAPSGSTANITGISVSMSTVYGAFIAAGALTGVASSSSVAFGPGTTIISAGPITGVADGQSVVYGNITGSVTFDGGIAISVSLGLGLLGVAPIVTDTASGGQTLSPNPNVPAFAGYGGNKWGANGGGGAPIGGGVTGQFGWDNPIAETISTAQRQANYIVNGKPVAAKESDTSMPTTTPDDSLPTGGDNAG